MNKRVFFMHTTANETRVVRMRYDGQSLGGYTVVLGGLGRGSNHHGGTIATQARLAQDTNSINGKILRITQSGAPAPGNPFGNHIHSYGHRDPQGLPWDRKGRLWSGGNRSGSDGRTQPDRAGPHVRLAELRGPLHRARRTHSPVTPPVRIPHAASPRTTGSYGRWWTTARTRPLRSGGGHPADPRARTPGFDLRHPRGILSGSIGQPPAPYGRLSELLGRVLMLRASRREDRKRVPQYSSP
ncbi:PQQ-dependent sugar dehydrogenase [Streptomyces sp. SD31]|uniref:PQQ-dependent sugar dehydrogenase n=1 Tax=Streptomyces sp. SD31 TaxID=3452208 RepID=UPI003F8AFEED